MKSLRPTAGSISLRRPWRIVLGLMVAVFLATAVDGVGVPSWVGVGDTSATETTLPTGGLASKSEHEGPEVVAAATSRCKQIKDRKRRRQCREAKATPRLLAAGDIASCSSTGDEATAKLLDGLAGTVATLGDNAYESGTTKEFADCYDPTWGRHKRRTRPAAGNHEYATTGAAGYFNYFGAAAGNPQKGYYSYALGSWHIVALNSNCSQVGGCGAGSAQEQWLRQDLANHPTNCTLAYWHHPRFSFGNYSNDTMTQALWQALYEAGAEIVLSGHDHNYQRYAPQTPGGTRDEARGIRQFVVGTGGKNHYSLGSPPPNVEASNGETFGVLQLTLRPAGYDWRFIPIAGKSFTDSGSGACH